MRFEFDKNGYVCCILYGCTTGSCVEYTGLVPSQPEVYADMDDWADRAKVQAYYLNDQGNLTYDASKAASLPSEDALAAYSAAQLKALGITDAITSAVNAKFATVIDTIYPVGSIYISADSTSPATLFGGTWEQIKDSFLLAAGTQPLGATGGSTSHQHVVPVGTRSGNTAATIATNYGYTSGNSVSGNKAAFSVANNTSSFSDILFPKTSSEYHVPPFVAVNVWKRTA